MSVIGSFIEFFEKYGKDKKPRKPVERMESESVGAVLMRLEDVEFYDSSTNEGFQVTNRGTGEVFDCSLYPFDADGIFVETSNGDIEMLRGQRLLRSVSNGKCIGVSPQDLEANYTIKLISHNNIGAQSSPGHIISGSLPKLL